MQVGKNVNLHGVSKQPNQNVILACLICLYVFLSIIELLYVIVYVYVSDLVLIACDSLVHDWKHNLQHSATCDPATFFTRCVEAAESECDFGMPSLSVFLSIIELLYMIVYVYMSDPVLIA